MKLLVVIGLLSFLVLAEKHRILLDEDSHFNNEELPICVLDDFTSLRYKAIQFAQFVAISIPGASRLLSWFTSKVFEPTFRNVHTEDEKESFFGAAPRTIRYEIQKVKALHIENVRAQPISILSRHRIRIEATTTTMQFVLDVNVLAGPYEPTEEEENESWWFILMKLVKTIMNFLKQFYQDGSADEEPVDNSEFELLSTVVVVLTIPSSSIQLDLDAYLVWEDDGLFSYVSNYFSQSYAVASFLKGPLKGEISETALNKFAGLNVRNVEVSFPTFHSEVRNPFYSGGDIHYANVVMQLVRRLTRQSDRFRDFLHETTSNVIRTGCNTFIEEALSEHFYKECRVVEHDGLRRLRGYTV